MLEVWVSVAVAEESPEPPPDRVAVGRLEPEVLLEASSSCSAVFLVPQVEFLTCSQANCCSALPWSPEIVALTQPMYHSLHI